MICIGYHMGGSVIWFLSTSGIYDIMNERAERVSDIIYATSW